MARRLTCSSAPGSSNRCVAPGTTASSLGQRSCCCASWLSASTWWSAPPTISSVGARTAPRFRARAGRPPRETTAFTRSPSSPAALSAAGELGDRVKAVVSRGGRPDLARNLGAVRAPTLLIVGGADHQVLALNHEAQQQLRCPSELAVVPGATHLFEEPGALEQVSRLAIDWLDRHLAQAEAVEAHAKHH